MNRTSGIISNWFVSKAYIAEDDKDLIRFGLEVVISQVLTILPMILYAVYTNQMFETIIFLCIFCTLRVLSNGYHLKRFFSCFIVTNLIYVSSIELSFIIDYLESARYFIILLSIGLAIYYKFIKSKSTKNSAFILITSIVSIFVAVLLKSGSNASLCNEVLFILLTIDVITYRNNQ